MPYYTQKGKGKDKGKTCVYKKSDKTKVGCTAGPIEKYLGALHANEEINESDELDWLKGPVYFKYEDIMDVLHLFLKVGDKIHLNGDLYLDNDGEKFVSLNNTVVRVGVIDGKRLKVHFGEEITNLDIWQEELGADFLYLGDISQDNEIMVMLPEKTINESEDFEWISDIGSDIENFIQELSKLIKQHVPVAELELDWDTTSDGGEYFGRVWLYDRFYELYMYDETFKVRFYALHPETDEYYLYHEYKNLPKTRLLTVLLNDMVSVSNKNLNESEEDEFEWLKGPAQIRFGDIKHNIEDYVSIGDTIHLSGPLYFTETSYDDPIILNNEPGVVTSFTDRKVRPKMDVKFGKNITSLPLWSSNIPENYVDLGSFETDDDILITLPKKSSIKESEEDEFDWVRGVETDLVPGEIYDIKTGNGYYWVPEMYVGKKWDEEFQVEMYKFKDLDGGGSGGKSVPYVKDLIEKGNIRPYDPNWSIKDELTFSDNIEDALKGNFVIYFKNGVYLDQTLPIQDKLFEMGFSFYTKGPNEYITNKDSSDKIQFFESFNWDQSNQRYNKMPSDQWDKKKILLMSFDRDKGRWRNKPNPRLDEQELFLTVRDHNATVINGDKYITNSVNESEDEWDWARKIIPREPNQVMVGDFYVIYGANNTVRYLLEILTVDEDHTTYLIHESEDKVGDEAAGSIQTTPLDNARYLVESGYWILMGENSPNHMTENEDFDWIQKQEPEKELKKNKKYVIDVSHLRPTPMRHSHDTSLTKQDILRKLEGLGYDVQHIDVDAAKYFYVEPTDGGPSWQYNEYGTPIEFNYWVDYNTDLMDDPSYGGKYQMVNVDEFMFLIDNNLIGESEENDFDWIVDTIPTRKDKIDFNKDRFETTLDYATVKVGDRFIASGGNIIWTLESKDKIKNVPYYYKIKLRNEKNKLKFYRWNSKYTFPTPYRPWKKIIGVKEPITESENDGFDWVRDIMNEPMSVCDAADSLEPGNIIMVNKLLDFGGLEQNMVTNVTAEVLVIDYLKQIQPDNQYNLKTILIHVNDDYNGFDESWVRAFKNEEHRKKCSDGRCMFLICGDKEFEGTMVTRMNTDLLESKKHINEVSGISFESRKWADVIYDEIMSNPEEQTRLIIDGYDHPEAFEGFPIDYVVIDYYDRLTGYGQEHSGYDKEGNYVVLLYIQPQLVKGQGGYSLKSALNHEMKHAWEDYNRLSKGLPSIEQTKESQELYNRDFILMLSDQNIRGPIKEVLKYYYYLSNLEKSAYLENVYDQNQQYERLIREIAGMDFEKFKDRFDLDVNWHLMNTAYDIPFLKKFKSPIDFIDYSAKELRSRALKMIKKINKMKYVHGKI